LKLSALSAAKYFKSYILSNPEEGQKLQRGTAVRTSLSTHVLSQTYVNLLIIETKAVFNLPVQAGSRKHTPPKSWAVGSNSSRSTNQKQNYSSQDCKKFRAQNEQKNNAATHEQVYP